MMKVQLTYFIVLLMELNIVIAWNPIENFFYKKEKTDNICESEKNGTLFPIPGDCHNYLYCSNEEAIKLPCTPGMEFSPTKLKCVRKEISDCDEIIQSTITTAITTEFTDTTTVTTDEITSWSSTTEIQINQCLISPHLPRHPYPFNCSAYIRCEDNQPFLFYCPFGKFFNPNILVCDDPEDAECQEEILPVSSEIQLSLEQPILTTDSYDICENQPISKKISYPGKCKKYIACDYPVPIAYYCCNDLAFDPDNEICDDPIAVNCTDENLITTTTKQQQTETTTTISPKLNHVCFEKPQDSFVPYPENCKKFIKCTQPIAFADYCPNGKYFNELLQICDVPKDSGCSKYTNFNLNI